MESNSTASDLRVLLASAGSFGFFLGCTTAGWQSAIENGQVLAGIIIYPPDHPFLWYCQMGWTLINQLSALLLCAGLSERVLTYLISGLLGMLSLQGLACIIYSLSQRCSVALLGSLFIYLIGWTGFGEIYAIHLTGESTFGILGCSASVLCLGLMSCGALRSSLLILGALPCLHPSWGAYMWLLAAMVCLIRPGSAIHVLKKHYPAFLAGLCILLISAASQGWFSRSIPVTTEKDRLLFDAFVQLWCDHRRPFYWNVHRQEINLLPWGAIFAGHSLLLSLLACYHFRRQGLLQLPYIMLTLGGFLSLGAAATTHLDPQSVPKLLQILMPGRWANLNNVVLGALLIGLLHHPKLESRWAHYLFLTAYSITLGPGTMVSMFARRCLDMLAIAWLCIRPMLHGTGSAKSDDMATDPGGVHLRGAMSPAILLILILSVLYTKSGDPIFLHDRLWGKPFFDKNNHELLRQIAAGEGMLATTTEFYKIGIPSGRPVLLDLQALNMFTMTPMAGEEINKILWALYGSDLEHPDPSCLRTGTIPSHVYQSLWQNRSPEEWLRLGKEFGFSDILVPSDWELKLQPVARDTSMRYYRLPRT